MQLNDYEILNVSAIPSPSLAVYPQLISANIKMALEIIGKNILRPHIKTCKTPEVVKMMLDAGILHFKCSTIAEAEMLGMLGATDVLLAYQPVAINVQRIKSIITAYPDTTFSCLVGKSQRRAFGCKST